MDIGKLKTELDEKRSLVEEKRDDALQLVESDKVEEAKDAMKEIEALAAEVKALAEKIEEFEKEEKTKADGDEQEDYKQEEVKTEEINSEERNLQNIKGEDDEMTFRKVEVNKQGTEERTAFEGYLETRDITTDGLKTDEGYVVVPVEENKKIIELADDIVSLKQYVTVKPVSNGSGKQPVRTTERAKLHTVEELNESPAIGVTPFTEVKYDISTKRGYVPYSKEYQEDGINLVADLKQFMSEVVINTENDDILKELATIRAKTIETLDGLKTLVNTGFPVGKGNRIKFTMGQSSFDELDRLKDKQGNYLLQNSISSPTGKKLFGRDIIVLDDVDLPTKDTMFIGDLKEIVYFDRSKMSVQWTNYLHFGECLAVALRNDVGKVESEKRKVNIYKITFTPPAELPEGL